MLLNSRSSKSLIVNLLSDFIMEKIGKDISTIIQVIDCENFLVVKGKSNSKDMLNLKLVMNQFKEKYDTVIGERKLTHTIDLIEYDKEMNECKNLTFTFHNSQNCSYHSSQISEFLNNGVSVDYVSHPKKLSEENFSYASDFPFGYSLNQGRGLYYYLKKIYYSIPTNYLVDSLIFDLNLEKENEEILNVFDVYRQDTDDILKSAILDSVDFNIKDLESSMKCFDLSFELLKPLEEHHELNKNRFDITII